LTETSSTWLKLGLFLASELFSVALKMYIFGATKLFINLSNLKGRLHIVHFLAVVYCFYNFVSFEVSIKTGKKYP
jgi:hypothetical protein